MANVPRKIANHPLCKIASEMAIFLPFDVCDDINSL